jgi:hypothetical protein
MCPAHDVYDLVGQNPHAAVQKPGIAAGCAEADLECLEQDDAMPARRQLSGRGASRKTCANDQDVGGAIAFQDFAARRRPGGRFPKAVAARITEHV